MPTLDTCPSSHQAGFSLLELIVVLALLGMASAIVAPASMRMVDSWRRATDVDIALGVLAALGDTARQRGEALRFEAGPVDANAIEGLPANWRLELETPLTVHPNGACSDSHGVLVLEDYRREVTIAAPFCRAQLGAPPP